MAYRRAKFHNKKTVVDGITFDSKKESERYKELKALSDKGIIAGLELQKSFCIIPKQKDERATYYKADFYYIDENNFQIVEDVKSEVTRKLPEYIMKRKLMKLLHPDILFVEII